jgi:hypothetical protein
MIMDACVLIDYFKAGFYVLELIAKYLGQVHVVREFTKNNTPILPVFLPVFCVAIMKEYFNIPSLSRLEYEQKSYGIWVYYFL